MKRLNLYLSLLSANVLLVTVERFSFTTKVFLQPYDFLRLHELFQMTVIILFTVVLPFLILYEVTSQWETVKKKRGLLLFTLFIVGIYYYATGNGVHEMASFTFNQYCPKEGFTDSLCGGQFFNDYYTGNIFYFVGAFMFTIVTVIFERMNPNKNFTKKDIKVATINAVIYSFAIFAYAAFDRVLVGLVYSVITAAVGLLLFIPVRKKFMQYPMTTYTAVVYTIATIASILVRFH